MDNFNLERDSLYLMIRRPISSPHTAGDMAIVYVLPDEKTGAVRLDYILPGANGILRTKHYANLTELSISPDERPSSDLKITVNLSTLEVKATLLKHTPSTSRVIFLRLGKVLQPTYARTWIEMCVEKTNLTRPNRVFQPDPLPSGSSSDLQDIHIGESGKTFLEFHKFLCQYNAHRNSHFSLSYTLPARLLDAIVSAVHVSADKSLGPMLMIGNPSELFYLLGRWQREEVVKPQAELR